MCRARMCFPFCGVAAVVATVLMSAVAQADFMFRELRRRGIGGERWRPAAR